MTILTAITGTSALAFIAVLMIRQRRHALADLRIGSAADHTERALWALAQIEDKLTAALEWAPLGYRALGALKLRRGLHNLAESLGPVRDLPVVRDAVQRLYAHIEEFLARPGTHLTAQQTAARNAIEDIQTLRLALEGRAANLLNP